MISTHVLDTGKGRPAAGISVSCEKLEAGSWKVEATGVTDGNGRIAELSKLVEAGLYRLVFETAGYSSFYPLVTVTVEITDPAQHYHIPLLLSPFGYTTYRGS
jgi:5-hydroxyisourate hydrolase